MHAGTLDGQHAFALQAHVARLITAVPTSLLDNKEHYYSVISEQVLHLIVYGLSKNDHVWFINIVLYVFFRLLVILLVVLPSVAYLVATDANPRMRTHCPAACCLLPAAVRGARSATPRCPSARCAQQQ
jgi:hypothetical protein